VTTNASVPRSPDEKASPETVMPPCKVGAIGLSSGAPGMDTEKLLSLGS
jgi:hypothetical protein